MERKPLYHVSLVTGKKYPYDEYTNHGFGKMKCGFVPGEGTICFNDLPENEYPYTLEYAPDPKPKWMD
jgi:hypothetical protein